MTYSSARCPCTVISRFVQPSVFKLYTELWLYAAMMEGNPCPENKELLIIPGAVHTDLYDKLDVIPFDQMVDFFRKAMV